MAVKFVDPTRPNPSRSLARLGPTKSSSASDPSGLSCPFVSSGTPGKSVSMSQPNLARLSGILVSPGSSDRSGSSRLSGRSGLTRSSGWSSLSGKQVGWVVGLVDPAWLSGQFGMSLSSSPLDLFWLFRLGHQARPTHLCRKASLVCFGRQAWPTCLSCQVCPTRMGRWACSTRLCRQVGPIRLDCLANPACHGCLVCQNRFELSLECEVEWEEFQISPFFRVFEFLLI